MERLSIAARVMLQTHVKYNIMGTALHWHYIVIELILSWILPFLLPDTWIPILFCDVMKTVGLHGALCKCCSRYCNDSNNSYTSHHRTSNNINDHQIGCLLVYWKQCGELVEFGVQLAWSVTEASVTMWASHRGSDILSMNARKLQKTISVQGRKKRGR